MKTTVQILKAARELISVPERWTQGVYARAYDGEPVTVDSFDAVYFCAVGAIAKVADEIIADVERSDAVRLLENVVGDAVPDFNDARGHAEVLAAFDKAIKLAEGA